MSKNKSVEYTESLGHLPNSEMVQAMRHYNLTTQERHTGIWLAILIGIQIVAAFSLAPIFITFAGLMTHGDSYLNIALGLAGYAITHTLSHPMIAYIAKKFGYRLAIIFGSVLFTIGSFVLAWGMARMQINIVILGRLLQGAGAIMTPALALGIEQCRPHARGGFLVLLGTGIGIGFSASMPLGALLTRIGQAFTLTHRLNAGTNIPTPALLAIGLGVLGLVSIFITCKKIPTPKHSLTDAFEYLRGVDYLHSITDKRMIAVNFGAFILPFTIMMLFYHIPFALRDIGGVAQSRVWFIYLFSFSIALLIVIPVVIVATSPRTLKGMLLTSVSLLMVGLLLLVYMPYGLLGVVGGLTVLFVSFNLSELTLSRIIPRMIEHELQPAALSIFLYLQMLGIVLGSFAGALIMETIGWGWLYLCSVIVIGTWLSIILMINHHHIDYTLPIDLQHT
jgi:MFS family permease